MNDGCLSALLKAKLLVALLGAPWLVIFVFPEKGRVAMLAPTCLLALYALLALFKRPTFAFEYLVHLGLRGMAIRLLSTGFAFLSTIMFLPFPLSDYGLSLAILSVAFFVCLYCAVIYVQVTPARR